MIARILIPLIILITLPVIYLHRHYLNRRKHHQVLWKTLIWIPAALMVVYTLGLSAGSDFAPADMNILYFYLFLLGVIVAPLAVFAICSVVGLLFCKLLHKRQNWGNLVGFCLALITLFIAIYGFTFGYNKTEVNEQEFVCKDLPAVFDGYRIVLFSDLHVGSYLGGREKVLEKNIRMINEQQGDMVVFVGDLQNLQPSELDPVQSMLSTIKAKDGVYSVMGNHDYPNYIKADFATEALNENLIKSKQRSMGWNVLLNENRVVRRGADSIVVMGVEDNTPGYTGKYTRRSDLQKALQGVKDGAFVVSLVHNPELWHYELLPDLKAQLTLSGHTHGGQLKFFGWTPASLKTDYVAGWYEENGRSLFVTSGLGALVPFRFGMSGEIVVLTLRKGK